MSAAAQPLAAATLPLPQFGKNLPSLPPQHQCRRKARRTSPAQGRALEVLGHAIEYLVDSRLYEAKELPSDAQAVHLLMGCSREVFSECEVVVSWYQKMQSTLLRRLYLRSDA